MIKLKFTGFEEAEKAARQKIEKAIRDPKFLQQVGDKWLKNIKQDLLQGRDVETRRPHENKLEDSTVKRRKALAPKNATDEFYKPTRALVFTGQLIRSLEFAITKGKPILTIIAKGMHGTYAGKRGRKIGKSIENQKLLEFHNFGEGQKVRKMVGMSEAGAKSMLSIARNAIRRLLLK